MAHRSCRAVARIVAAAGAAALAGCSGSSGVSTTQARLTPVTVSSDTSLEVARLVDRDTTSALPVAQATRVVLTFRHPVLPYALKAHGATNLAVTASNLGTLSADGMGGWLSGTFGTTRATSSLEVLLTPTGPGASLTELEVWGPVAARAPRELAALAEARRDAATQSSGAESVRGRSVVERSADVPGAPPEDLLTVAATPAAGALRVDPVDLAARCLRASLPGGVAVRSARRAYLVYEANVQRPVVLSTSLNGGAPSGGFWLAATDRRATQVEELDPEQLTGGDAVALCLPADATADVSVDGLRLVL
ncbi:MAG TPA: hypothetical protein VFP50_02655, partial [Anaeromyxobacteraceae bacterium]|nr:hypothetical protein [Anaeromyxobacteraceae bacterium]